MSAPATSTTAARVASPRSAKAGIGGLEFIVLIATLTSIVSLAIDSMLPALPVIGDRFGLTSDNERQLVIVVFVLAFGPTQILFGPLTDRIGRRAILLGGLALFALASIGAGMTESWSALLACRAAQGFGAAAVRVSSQAIVRDCYSGNEMARIMSYIFTVFMLVPVAAPAIGQIVISLTDWHWLFAFLGLSAAGLMIWSATRLGETLPAPERRPLSVASITGAFREVLTTPVTLGYTLAVTFFMGALFAFIVSIQQIIEVIYGLEAWFAVIFAGSASATAVASLTNAGLVRRFGMRRTSHAALVSFTLFGTALLVLGLSTALPPFTLTIALITMSLMSFGFVAGSFNALAMEPLGHLAGAASSVLGAISATGGAVLGAIVGQAFDGTIVPLAAAYTGFGVAALVIVLITERGRLFRAD